MIKDCFLIAFDGSHASGKTTLKYSVAAKLKELGLECVVMYEPARNNPLVDDVVLRDRENFDIPLEVDLLMNHISSCIRGTRNGNIILSDRTPANVIAYTNLLVKSKDDKELDFWNKCNELVESWIKFYDLIFYCQDFYSENENQDKMRSKVLGMQQSVDLETRKQYEKFNCNLQYIPRGLTLDKKADWVINKIQSKFDLKRIIC